MGIAGAKGNPHGCSVAVSPARCPGCLWEHIVGQLRAAPLMPGSVDFHHSFASVHCSLHLFLALDPRPASGLGARTDMLYHCPRSLPRPLMCRRKSGPHHHPLPLRAPREGLSSRGVQWIGGGGFSQVLEETKLPAFVPALPSAPMLFLHAPLWQTPPPSLSLKSFLWKPSLTLLTSYTLPSFNCNVTISLCHYQFFFLKFYLFIYLFMLCWVFVSV